MKETISTSKKPPKAENELPPTSKIPTADPLASLRSVRDLLHLLTIKKSLLHSAAKFLCERRSSVFWRRQKSCSILHRQIWLRTHKVCHSSQIKFSATSPTQQILLPPRFWVDTWPAATRVFLPKTKGGREERPWERGWFNVCYWPQNC